MRSRGDNIASQCPKLRIVNTLCCTQHTCFASVFAPFNSVFKRLGAKNFFLAKNIASQCPKLRIVAKNTSNFQVGLYSNITATTLQRLLIKNKQLQNLCGYSKIFFSDLFYFGNNNDGKGIIRIFFRAMTYRPEIFLFFTHLPADFSLY